VLKHHAIEIYEEMEVKLHTSLTMALDEAEWGASHSSCFTSKERVPSTHCIGDWVSIIAGLHIVTENPRLYGEIESQSYNS
jgi:hypothetical protein